MSRFGISAVLIDTFTDFCLLHLSTLKFYLGRPEDVYIVLQTGLLDAN